MANTARAPAQQGGDEVRPLRIDVWGHLYAPMRTLAQVATGKPRLELGHGRDLPSVITALLHGDIDAAFGRVHAPLPAGLPHPLVRLEPVDAILHADHPLANAPAIRPAQLRDGVLWTPGALHRLDFLHRFAMAFGIHQHAEGTNLGLDRFLADLAADMHRFSRLPADILLPPHPAIRSIPLIDPAALYAWSLLWRDNGGHPLLNTLTSAFVTEAERNRWLEHDPTRDWLPERHSTDASALTTS
ncbi:type 2 periplasmic-binding domain-containing protein [Nonomuraea antri]|uniref:LysR substrate-binding domain-containing protein n=1 Tax=Nonomuraea antri TaxID=2730852 RepID=UPI001C2C0794|nr:LysR substrate-binding domain-containing protein [Nonomuraea antri]